MPRSCYNRCLTAAGIYTPPRVQRIDIFAPEQLIAPRSLATDETAGQKSGPASCRILVFGREIRRQASKKDEDRDNDDDEDDELAHSGVLGAIISPLTSTAAEVFAKLIGS